VTILSAYITTRDGKPIQKDMPIFSSLESELYNTKVINIQDRTYYELVTGKVLTGPEGSLLIAIITFVHTNMAHSSPYRFDWDETQDAFFSHLQLTREMLQLFETKFKTDSGKPVDEEILEREYEKLQSMIDKYMDIQKTFSSSLFDRINGLDLEERVKIEEPSPEQIEDLYVRSVGLSEPQAKASCDLRPWRRIKWAARAMRRKALCPSFMWKTSGLMSSSFSS